MLDMSALHNSALNALVFEASSLLALLRVYALLFSITLFSLSLSPSLSPLNTIYVRVQRFYCMFIFTNVHTTHARRFILDDPSEQ